MLAAHITSRATSRRRSSLQAPRLSWRLQAPRTTAQLPVELGFADSDAGILPGRSRQGGAHVANPLERAPGQFEGSTTTAESTTLATRAVRQ
jgi:hypothetical protein